MDWTQGLEQCRLFKANTAVNHWLMPDGGWCSIAQSLPPGNAEITQELKCLKPCQSIESSYLLFSDKFRVSYIFFKEKQAVVSGGSRERSALALVLPGSHPDLHHISPEQEFLEFLQQELQP